jgi:hypothetical protein
LNHRRKTLEKDDPFRSGINSPSTSSNDHYLQKLTLLQAHPEGDFIKICFIKIYVGSEP